MEKIKTIKEAAIDYVTAISQENFFGRLIEPKGAGIELCNAFEAGVKFARQWISVKEELPPCDGCDYLLRNKKWIHPDFNPHGIRFGFYNADLGSDSDENDHTWTHIHWSNYSDMYITEHDTPTHWRRIEFK
jgi:hypothetical protein